MIKSVEKFHSLFQIKNVSFSGQTREPKSPHKSHTLSKSSVINQFSCKIVLTEPVLMPTLIWLCVVHRIVSKEGSIVLVSRVSWYMELKRGQWRLMTWEVWKGHLERMMVRWMCGVSLKDRKRSEDLYNLLGIDCVADVVRRGRLRWFGHLERKSVNDWVSACRGLVVEGTRGRGRSRKTWEQCVRDDMKLLGLHPEWAVF